MTPSTTHRLAWATTKLVALLATGLFCGSISQAQIYWDHGANNNRWGSANNWRPNGVPGAGDDVILDNTFDANLPATIALRADQAANSLTFDLGSNLSIINGTGSRTLALTSGDITVGAGNNGVLSLDMTTLALGGDSVMDIGGTGNLTINSVVADSGGTRSLTKAGAAELVLSAANTFSGGVTISAGTLTLTNAAALGSGDVTLAGGTLKLSGINLTAGSLNVTANSIIDFSGSSTLNLSSFTIAAGVTLDIINWTQATDFFYTANWSGAVYDTMGSAPMNQVTFSGFGSSETGWDSYDTQVRPRVPESPTYGALLAALLVGIFAWRRRQ